MGFFSSDETTTKTLGNCISCKKTISGEVSVKTGTVKNANDAIILKDGAIICKGCVDAKKLSHSKVSGATKAGLIALYKSNGLVSPDDFTPTKRVCGHGMFESTVCLEVDETRELINIPIIRSGWVNDEYYDNVFPWSKILDFKVIDSGIQILEGVSMLRAAVGGLVFGGVGAIVASLLPSRKLTNKCTELTVKVVIDDLRVNSAFIYLVGDNSSFGVYGIERDDEEWRDVTRELEECLSILTIILKRNQGNLSSEATQAMLTPSNTSGQSSNDVIDSIKKLAELREAGIISQEEFDAKKAELMARI